MDREELRDRAIEQTRDKLKSAADRDRLMVKAINFLDENNNNFNAEMERFRDWYGLHFPELEKEITDDRHLIKILSNGLKRDELDAFSDMAESSTGMPLTDDDVEMLEKAYESLQKKLEMREKIESYVEKVAAEEMPNLETVVGPLLAARIVALAGGLEETAKKPSSTIQMLGAEKALFRYLHGEGTPPKHGVLFQHNFVNSLPENKRGKMARFLANKAVMAARIDQYGDKNKGEELRQECQEKFAELKGN
jgi:nucleolar protein 56